MIMETNQEKLDNLRSWTRNEKTNLENLLDEVETTRNNIKIYQTEINKIKRILLEEQVRAEVNADIKLKGNKQT